MHYLVTGAAGFIGSKVCANLLSRGETVYGIDNLNDYYDPALKLARLRELGIEAAGSGKARSVTHASFTFRTAGLEDRKALEEVFADGPFDRVINLAAQAGVRYSIDNPSAYIESNLIGFFNILELCRQHKVAHLCYASSSSVYGLNRSRPFKESEGTNHPTSLYAATKKSNELMAHCYSHLYGLPTTGLRFFTVYGPWGRPDMAYFKFASAILSGKTIDIYNNGDMYRDFTYIDDIAAGVILTADRIASPDPAWDALNPDPSASSAPYRVYNIGNNHPVRISAFVETLEKVLGKTAQKRYLPMQMGDVYATEADVSALERDFGWKPTTRLEEGLKSFAEWYLPYRDGK